MLKIVSVKASGAWKGDPVDVVVLDSTERNGRIRNLTGIRGNTIEISVENMPNLRAGDALTTENGQFVEVVGKPEALMEVRPASERDLVRIAWQLGNHHLPMQIVGKKIRIRRSADIAAILAGIGVRTLEIEAPFDPEGGAYLAQVEQQHDHACGCGHDHGHHHHDHHHDHGHKHAHDHKHAQHGDHGHDHRHGHHDHKH